MAIDINQWEMIEAAKVKGRALSAGYPDLLIHFPEAPVRPDSDEIARHHNAKHPIADSHAVFRELGLELDVIDRAVIRGCEKVVDLNENEDTASWDGDVVRYPLSFIRGPYDLVIDPGTSEHCFNIAQALVNLANAVKVGGVISQALPTTMVNHGYWNVNPVALVDFYEFNGFEIEDLVIRAPREVFKPARNERAMRMKGVPEESVTIITARRLKDQEFRWPQQGST